MATKKRAPSQRASRMDLSDASTPLHYAEPVPASMRMPVNGADLGYNRRTGVSLRMADLMDELAQRRTVGLAPSEIIRRDLQRFYAMCEAERSALGNELTPDEWRDLRGAVAGASFATPKHLRTMWAYAAEAFGIEHRITVMLRGASMGRLYAILDALESLPWEPWSREASALVGVSAVGPDGVDRVEA